MKIILVSHGSYSRGLLESVQMVLGAQENLVAYGLFPEETPAVLTEKLEKEIKETGETEILFMTDLFHGSPFNCVVSLMRDYKFHHITGINLPLLIEAIMNRNGGVSAEDVCDRIIEMAPGTIMNVGKYLNEEVTT
jgi:mannose/fructose/sorbose-specific phosphotransferase system IIA component